MERWVGQNIGASHLLHFRSELGSNVPKPFPPQLLVSSLVIFEIVHLK